VKAETECQQLIAKCVQHLPPNHSLTLTGRNTLGEILRSLKRLPEAEKEYRIVLEGRERFLPPGHYLVLRACYNLALCLHLQGKNEEARPLAERAAQGVKSALSSDNPERKSYEELWGKLSAE
jgi:tetratricopeptide (TPR) repeat protein